MERESRSPFSVAVSAARRRRSVGGEAQQGFIRRSFNATLNESRDPAGKRSLEEWRDLRLAEVESRKAAAQAYMEIIIDKQCLSAIQVIVCSRQVESLKTQGFKIFFNCIS